MVVLIYLVEFEFLTVPNYWVFKDHTYSKPLEAEIDTENAKVAGIKAESREYNFFADEVNEEILNDFIENDLMEETSNESKIKIECEIKYERLEDKRYSKLNETELNALLMQIQRSPPKYKQNGLLAFSEVK